MSSRVIRPLSRKPYSSMAAIMTKDATSRVTVSLGDWKVPAGTQESRPQNDVWNQALVPEFAYADRDTKLKRIWLAAHLHKSDEYTMRVVSENVNSLHESLGEKAKDILPIFRELNAAKDLNAMYVERCHSLTSQKRLAEQAASNLKATIADMQALADSHQMPMSTDEEIESVGSKLWVWLGAAPARRFAAEDSIGGVPGMVDRLSMRYDAQVGAAEEEAFRAHALLKEIKGDRMIEAVVAAKESETKKRLRAVVDELERSSMRLYLDECSDAENLEALS